MKIKQFLRFLEMTLKYKQSSFWHPILHQPFPHFTSAGEAINNEEVERRAASRSFIGFLQSSNKKILAHTTCLFYVGFAHCSRHCLYPRPLGSIRTDNSWFKFLAIRLNHEFPLIRPIIPKSNMTKIASFDNTDVLYRHSLHHIINRVQN